VAVLNALGIEEAAVRVDVTGHRTSGIELVYVRAAASLTNAALLLIAPTPHASCYIRHKNAALCLCCIDVLILLFS
jgi:hypothetical protein